MTLEDFEKSLADSHRDRDRDKGRHEKSRDKDREKDHSRHRHHHRHHRHSSRHHDSHYDDEDGGHRSKRSRRSRDEEEEDREKRHRGKHRHGDRETEENQDEKAESVVDPEAGQLKRDSWMEAPSALDIDYIQKRAEKPPDGPVSRQLQADFVLKIHEKELNHHLHDLNVERVPESIADEPANHEVDYTFGDSGAKWRMTKLKAVYRQADDTGQSVEDVAVERYGDLRSFDDAREEEIELDRRQTYGDGYVGKEKPSGELFQEGKLDMGMRRGQEPPHDDGLEEKVVQGQPVETQPVQATTQPLDQTALNRLKAQMMKAKLRGSSDAANLGAEYNTAMSSFANRRQPEVVVLGAMENRMLAGGSRNEVKSVENRRGRERGQVEENEDMSVEDMVREERRTRNQAGGDGQRFAERIAKDAKFDNDLEYMDENASKLAKRVQKSEVNIKNTAISDFQKMNRILDNCPLCHHEDTNTPPVAPVVSLATRAYLTLPTEPELSEGAACIVPIQHRNNLLECDDDEWEEIRNFMKSLTRMYHDQGRDVIFYENASQPQRRKHAAMEVVPLPYSLGETAPAFFKEAILTSDEEWTQHKKLIDTLSKSKQGLGKLAFRRTLVKEMPYFHVWFQLDGGLGHVVEDAKRWPKGDLFAREIIGGMLDLEPDVIKRQGRWNKGGDPRVDGFRKRWRKFDWTSVLTEGQLDQ